MRISLALSLLTATAAAAAPLTQLTFSSSSLSDLTIASLGLSPSLSSQLAIHVDSLPEKRVVQLGPNDDQRITITEGEKAVLVAQGRRFVDVTDEDPALFGGFGTAFEERDPAYPEPFPALAYTKAILQPLFDNLDLGEMKSFLDKFTSFRTRYYRSETGRESQAFLLATLRSIVAENPTNRANITITEFAHPWGQNSIIARFSPSSSSPSASSSSTVIISAHQDSTNLLPFLPAPGADDDGSGTTSTLTAFQSLVRASFIPSSNAVEFHWYSAEEGGLLGSQAVAQKYAKEGKKVRAMIQMDMTAWVKKGTKETIGLITDFTDETFTAFLREVVDAYANVGWTDTLCGYACSDHASWSKVGVPAAFTIESTFDDSNHNIHSTSDTITYSKEFSFKHMAEFSRVALGIAVELGGGENLFSAAS